MNTIEQAAKRLEELRRAGVDINPADIARSPVAEPAIESRPKAPVAAPAPAVAMDVAPARAAREEIPADLRRSRHVNLDFQRMASCGLLVPGNPRSQLEEEFRIIKRPLLENVRGQSASRPKRANIIMVTSAVPGEGKTQTAINLAVSIAMELDHTVLLVEADVIRPSALERMGVSVSKGLLDLLTAPETDLSEVLLKTNIPKLTLLPAGTSSSRSTELLASAAMDALLEELATTYPDRVIVFDTPPLLPSTESRVLATSMGQVLMVVESGKTPLNTVKLAFATVQECPVVMSMLNKYTGPKGNRTYGYYAP
ncbi:XrtA-associated tyrosine autokinase [Aquabacterium sp.]|uniref:XrtA-associated tyrosine autokinase n=1 Tax=Aquabacterium sp. TaxID=1872578 RepID=UPI0019A7D9CF|nr:XrtA-associated tyrosine autokinase [Aquabacterium sp.]MBC7700128.1 AAA family ATPase [Aquabacterium sp.]